MVRAGNLFAAASIVLLVFGLVLSNFFEKTSSMTVTLPSSTYAVGYQVPCYGLAGLFAIFACFYALNWIRLSEAAVDWHLWLSLIGVAIFGFAFALFAGIAATDARQQAGQGTLLVVAAGLLAGPAVFVVGQFLLVLALIRR
jgi:hypothetical protein